MCWQAAVEISEKCLRKFFEFRAPKGAKAYSLWREPQDGGPSVICAGFLGLAPQALGRRPLRGLRRNYPLRA
jgi:hypothetical protein